MANPCHIPLGSRKHRPIKELINELVQQFFLFLSVRKLRYRELIWVGECGRSIIYFYRDKNYPGNEQVSVQCLIGLRKIALPTKFFIISHIESDAATRRLLTIRQPN